jgi:RNA polymerase sigma-70 factor (ECF subfamily)
MALAVLAMAGAPETPEEQPGGSGGASLEAAHLEAARSGDLAAFEMLMRQYEKLVLVTALRLVGNLPDAQDVSQEVFLKLYRNLRKMDAARSIAGWLYRVTVNACRDLQRRRRPEAPVEFAEDVPAGGMDPQQAATVAERRRVLEMSLRMLPEKERAALVLRDLEGLSTEEVARVLGSSEATVRSQISKARVKVRGFVERYFTSRQFRSE